MYTIAETNNEAKLVLEPMVLEPEATNATTFYSAGEEILKISKDGFWVKGVRVPADDKEYISVYNAFREWLVWEGLTR